MGTEQEKQFVHEYTRPRTAHLEAVATREDEILHVRVRGEQVRRIALELPRWLWTDPAPKRLVVQFQGRTRTVVPKPDVALFLARMAEHFDPARAPVAVARM